MGSMKKMKSSNDVLEELMERYPILQNSKADIVKAYEVLKKCFTDGNKLMIAGNGGSAADSDHITGELTKSFLFKRKIDPEVDSYLRSTYGEEGAKLAANLEGGLPVIPLTTFNASNSAFSNDVEPKVMFAQLVNALGKKGDVFLGITTSGNSGNILYAFMTAKARGMHTIALTGGTGGKCPGLADTCIIVGEKETFKVQELHLPVYHALCSMVEADLFDSVERFCSYMGA